MSRVPESLPYRPMMPLYGQGVSQPWNTQRPSTHPGIQLISQAYGGLQPGGLRVEDDYTPTQALQPTSYNSGQTTTNGQNIQGPMANFYRLMGR